MEDLHLLYALAGLLAVALILASRRLAALPVTEPMVGMLAGLAIGGAGADLLTIPGDHRAATSTFAHGVTQIAGRRLYARRNGDR